MLNTGSLTRNYAGSIHDIMYSFGLRSPDIMSILEWKIIDNTNISCQRPRGSVSVTNEFNSTALKASQIYDLFRPV